MPDQPEKKEEKKESIGKIWGKYLKTLSSSENEAIKEDMSKGLSGFRKYLNSLSEAELKALVK